MTTTLQPDNSPEDAAPVTRGYAWSGAVKQSKLPAGAREMAQLVATYIKDCSVGTFVSIERLAKASSRCPRTIKARLKALETSGWLRVDRQRGPDGRMLGNLYYPLFPEPVADTPEPSTPKLRLVKSDAPIQGQNTAPGANPARGPGANYSISPGANSAPITIDKITIQGEPSSPAPKASKATKRPDDGSRLPDDWTLPDEWLQRARMRYVAISEQAIRDAGEKFGNYWKTCIGKKAKKRLWVLAWDNWCKTEWGTTNRSGQPMNWGRNAWDQRRESDETARRRREIERLAGGTV